MRRKLGANEEPDRDHRYFMVELPTTSGPQWKPVAKFSHSDRGDGRLNRKVERDVRGRLRLNAKELGDFVACKIDGEKAKGLYLARA